MKTQDNPNQMYDDHGNQTSEARVLPTGGDSNIITGYQGYLEEMAFRRERNKDLSKDCQFKLPKWESLRIYFKDGEYL